MTQPPDPRYAPGPPPAVSSSASPPPYDDGSYVHPHQRAVLWTTRAITYLVYAFIIAVEIILILGFLLLLGGANSSSSFVEWSYRNLDRVMKPFRGIFTPIEIGTSGSNEVQSVFDTSVLFAMIVYAIVGIVIYGLSSWLTKKLHRLDIEDREYHARVARERQAYLDRAAAEQNAAAWAAASRSTAPQYASTQPQPATPQPASTQPQPATPPPGSTQPQPATPPPGSTQPQPATPPPASSEQQRPDVPPPPA